MELTPKLKLGSSPIWYLDLTVVLTLLITCLVIILFVKICTSKLELVPLKLQNMLEIFAEFILGLVSSQFDEKSKYKFYSFAFTLFLFIFVANQLGLFFNFIVVPKVTIPSLDIFANKHYSLWKSPTSDINVPLALAFAITFVSHFLGIKRSATKYFSHYFKPFWPMFILHFFDEVAKPITHGLRLWANIFAGEVLILIMLKAGPLFTGLPLVIWLFYSFFVGVIQAYVFTVLAMVYISQKYTLND